MRDDAAKVLWTKRWLLLGTLSALLGCPGRGPVAEEAVPPSRERSADRSGGRMAPPAAPTGEGAGSEHVTEVSKPRVAASASGDEASDCIAERRSHAVRYLIDHHGSRLAERLGHAPGRADYAEPSRCLAVRELPDLDGDGEPEVEVVEGCSWGTHGGLHVLYFSSEGCPGFADALVSGELRALDDRHGGVRALGATWSNGCAGRDFEWTRYHWDGSGYRVADRATCHLCGNDAPRPESSHPRCRRARERMNP